MNNVPNGFYCGKSAYQMILDNCDPDKVTVVSDLSFMYLDCVFYKDELLQDTDVIGFGLPYSLMANQIKAGRQGKRPQGLIND